MKKKYIELMDKTLDAYSHEHITSYFERVKKEGLTEHGFPRLTANIGILIAHGRRRELTPLFIEMMDFVIESFPRGKAANDFSVKEVVFCIMALEEHGGISSEKLGEWKNGLRKIDKYVAYDIYAKTPTDKVFNWALFTTVSEYMRQYLGLCDSREFIDIQIPTQLHWLDENGMYRDAEIDPPMMYDLVPRGLFSVLLHFGYDGKYRKEIDTALRKAGLLTLKMQSTNGEVPFGGRSNQFLNNEAQIAIIFEFEAARYKKEGNDLLASRFKAAAYRAIKSIERYLSKKTIRHIKNNFELSTKYGCENYGYFDKYMITTASFLYAAYLISDNSIPVSESSYFDEPSVFVTSEHFHKVFMKAGGYTIEFDTSADPHYDASGLGRVHKADAPAHICLSVPASSHPNYTIDREDAIDLSLSAGVNDGQTPIFATTKETKYELISLSNGEDQASAEFKNTFKTGKCVNTYYEVDKDGVSITARSDGAVYYMLPTFLFDGESHTDISVSDNTITVDYLGWRLTYKTDGKISLLSGMGCNRNGYYAPYYAEGENSLSVKITIEKI